jgi:flavin-dependent dehydrogenase
MVNELRKSTEILIIGAGPAGALAAALLCRQGREVLILEREQFPRFNIGESLLPQSMEYLEQAGLLGIVREAGFQLKNGAAFTRGSRYALFDFHEKHSPGWSTSYQVPRARFDQLLAQAAEAQGAEVRYRHEVVAVDVSGDRPQVEARAPDGKEYIVDAGFILDASGFGRVLSRLLHLETPSTFPPRKAVYTHVEDGIAEAAFDRNKTLIAIHPQRVGLWYWLIPFADGHCSIGAVGEIDFIATDQGNELHRLQTLIAEEPSLRRLLAKARWDSPARQIVGYAVNVKSLWGRGYALLGNAAEFLDPIFSSGVTIAFKSASLAAALLQRQFAGLTVDWHDEFEAPFKIGVETFRAFVESWYEGSLQRIFFYRKPSPQILRMISGILAGYAWDKSNPYVKETRRRLAALEKLCCQR